MYLIIPKTSRFSHPPEKEKKKKREKGKNSRNKRKKVKKFTVKGRKILKEEILKFQKQLVPNSQLPPNNSPKSWPNRRIQVEQPTGKARKNAIPWFDIVFHHPFANVSVN